MDYEGLMDLLAVPNLEELQKVYKGWVEESLLNQDHVRQPKWTESIAVGSQVFVSDTKEKLGTRADGRKVVGGNGSYELREGNVSYRPDLGAENGVLSLQNVYYWDISNRI